MTWNGWKPHARVANVERHLLTEGSGGNPPYVTLRVRVEWTWLWFSLTVRQTLTHALGGGPVLISSIEEHVDASHAWLRDAAPRKVNVLQFQPEATACASADGCGVGSEAA